MMKRLLLLLASITLVATLGWAKGGVEKLPEIDASEGVRVGDYIEHPVLAKMVEDGLIPPIEERLPVPGDIHVIPSIPSMKGVEQARYGGTLYLANAGEVDRPFAIVLNSGGQVGAFETSRGGEVGQPSVYKGYEVNTDFTEWTFFLRRGLKWSDGYEFTTQELYEWWVLWWATPDVSWAFPAGSEPENLTVSSDSVSVSNYDRANGRTITKTVIDDYTWTLTCDEPWPTFINDLSHMHYTADLGFAPRPTHFLKQFHPAEIGEDKAEELAEEYGFENWEALWNHYAIPHLQGSYQARGGIFPPTLAPYVVVDKTETGMIYERNPFYWKIDTNGRQLPYVDKVIIEHVSDGDIAFGKLLSGEVDLGDLSTDNLSVFLESSTAQDYNVVRSVGGTWPNYLQFNFMYDDPVVRELFRTKEFRIALSLAIDREKQNELVFAGQGIPSQPTVLPANPYFKEEYMYAYSDYDPEEAMRLLDELDVTDKDGDGWRENADGEDIFFTIDYLGSANDMGELTVDDWQAIGLNTTIQGYDASLFWPSRATGRQAIHTWHADEGGPVLFASSQGEFVPSHLVGNEAENSWFNYYTTGEGDDPPPPEAIEMYEAYRDFTSATSAAAQARAADTILKSQAENLWSIGAVGMIAQFAGYHADLAGMWVEADGDPKIAGWDFWTVREWNGEHLYFQTRPLLEYGESRLPQWYPTDQWTDPLGLSKRENWF